MRWYPWDKIGDRELAERLAVAVTPGGVWLNVENYRRVAKRTGGGSGRCAGCGDRVDLGRVRAQPEAAEEALREGFEG